ncbi:hypothetical protein [Streptomyces sp. PTD5-9]|uniref:hypothetical protein n=1 Tax=Streptomyces sp. PTD5-9 TaxID=3120150 RepID=UPI003009BC15
MGTSPDPHREPDPQAPGRHPGPDPLGPRLRDEIDDQVAEAFDAYMADRLAEPGPLRTALLSGRGARVVPATIALGALATALAPHTAAAVGWIWGAIALVDIAWLRLGHRT